MEKEETREKKEKEEKKEEESNMKAINFEGKVNTSAHEKYLGGREGCFLN